MKQYKACPEETSLLVGGGSCLCGGKMIIGAFT
jgi:hypothetical protein